jgi:hypothetical protein
VGPTYTVHWSQSASLEKIEQYVQDALKGVERERIVSISHAMVGVGTFGERRLYSVLVTIRDP